MVAWPGSGEDLPLLADCSVLVLTIQGKGELAHFLLPTVPFMRPPPS